MSEQINKLLASSKQVIRDCALPNGAIVAANSTKEYYPKEAKYYKFVWPRDAMYTCMAARLLAIPIQEKFFRWCMRAEGWQKTGLFYEKYFVNGKKALKHFQPDQTGSVLMTVHDYYKDDKESALKYEFLIRKSADGLCKVWNKDHFSLVTQDLWEERLAFPDLKENFTYSLAICARGLECAHELIPNDAWLKTAKEMKATLQKNFKEYFYRSFGKMSDERVDASLLGLLWPANLVLPSDPRTKKTLALIEKNLVKDGGIHRYEHDEYDGWMHDKNTHRKKGAGYWPLLNFWMTIICLETGNKKKALAYYDKVLVDVQKKKFLPEQIFDNNFQVSVSPLCWSHAMFVLATKALRYF